MSSIDRPCQGVKTLKNNAIIMITVIILMGRVERKPAVAAFEDKGADQSTHPRSLISAFVVRPLEIIIDKLATRKISAF